MADIIDGLYSWVSFLPRITKTNLIEIIIIAVLLYELLVWIMNTRAWTLLKGILLILCFYVLTYIFRLDNIKWILNTIATPAVTMAIVIFQPELRKALEQLGSRNPLTGILTFDDGKDNSGFTDRTINELVKATFDIFEHNTPLHDGAVVIHGNRVAAATCYLPLSDNMSISKELGTRHRAAVGVSEVTDSLTIVVSEETGRVSVASEGGLKRAVDADALRELLMDLKHVEGEGSRFKILKGRRKNEGKIAK